MKLLIGTLLLVITSAGLGKAQDSVVRATRVQDAKVTAEIIASSSTTVVKGAPFSADAVNESVQVLADGNKITRSFTTRMYRDSDGRFRREDVPGPGGAVGSVIRVQQAISIFDPVSNYRYLLDPERKTARRINTQPGSREGAVIVNGQSMSYSIRSQVETNAARQTQVVALPNLNSPDDSGKSESLGVRNFEGVQAEGTRTTRTLPAGAIGNEQPIEIVYERWYSKDLQLIVYSKHNDPRFGEQTYRLTNINRSEPDRSLFTPPADYKILAEPRMVERLEPVKRKILNDEN